MNGPTSLTTQDTVVTLAGNAPVAVKTISVNGIAYPITWTSVTGWSMRVPVNSGSNTLSLQGLDVRGKPVADAAATLSVTSTGSPERPQDFIVINEILYSPALTNAAFVELHNRSTRSTFDLSNYRFNGLDYTFPQGTLFGPQAFLVLAKDRTAFASAYRNSIPVFDQFNGKLDPDGETLALLEPGSIPGEDIVISKVRYGITPPWPALPANSGVSLQLIDPAQDVRRVGNWTVSALPPFSTPGRDNSVRRNLSPFPAVWINEVLPENSASLQDSAGEFDPWLELHNAGPDPIALDGLYLSDNHATLTPWAIPAGLSLKPGEFKVSARSDFPKGGADLLVSSDARQHVPTFSEITFFRKPPLCEAKLNVYRTFPLRLVRNYDSAQTWVTFENNFLPTPWAGPGRDNTVADPMLKHIPQPAETYFTNWTDAQVLRDWFSLLPGSPALRRGPNGRDAGGVIPLGASVTGEPSSPTALISATLTMGPNRKGRGIQEAGWPNGSGYSHYNSSTCRRKPPIATSQFVIRTRTARNAFTGSSARQRGDSRPNRGAVRSSARQTRACGLAGKTTPAKPAIIRNHPLDREPFRRSIETGGTQSLALGRIAR